MASFTPDELNIIYSRGFEGTSGPMVPVRCNRIHAEGITYYRTLERGQTLISIGNIDAWVAGSLGGSKVFFISPVTANDPDSPYNGARAIKVTWWGDGSYGRTNIKFLDGDSNELPGINYEGYFYKENINETYSGLAFIELVYSSYANEFLFAVGCTSFHIKNTSYNDSNAVQFINGTQWTANQPYWYWFHQNDSGFYDPENEVPEITPGGGGGDWYRNSDTVGFSGLPSLDVLSFNIVSMYKVSTAQMASLSAYLWSDSFIDNLKKAWNDPFQNIINIAFVPMSGELATSASNIRIGNLDTGVGTARLTKSLYEKDFGTINMKELYKSFADYAPFTKLRCYLPGAGVRELNPDDYMDGSIHLKGFIDLFSGTCVYQLLSERHGRSHIVDHYEANLLTQIPITGANFIDAYKSIINGSAQIASGAVNGNPAAVISGAVNGITAKPTYEKAGSVSGAAMRLSVQTPYIFFDTPQLRQPTNFRQLNGYTSNIYARLGDCTDYVRVKYMDISGINAPDNIKQKILDSLYKGVHIH